jgi:hypothetical protein
MLVVETVYSNQELADMHFLYGLAGGNVVVVRLIGIQDKVVQTGKNVLVCIAAVVNMGILHLVLPTGDYQDLRLLT